MTHPDALRPPIEHVIAIGTSAGGLGALSTLLDALPRSFPSAILVVQHLAPDHHSYLAELIQHHSLLQVNEARDGETIQAGHVYVAVPDRHMEVDAEGTLHLGSDPPVRFSRPSVDVLFRSLARSFGARGVAVVLTGAGSDGAQGALEVHRAGGLVLVQDQASAFNSGMPGAAIRTGVADAVLTLDEIADYLNRLGDSAKAGT